MIAYSKIRLLLSHTNQGRLTRFLITSGLKPTCNRNAKSPFSKGILVFSADFEMAWAFRFSKTKKDQALTLGLQERNNVPTILHLFNQHKIPVTWATVGHLFLSRCSRNENGMAHPDLPRPRVFRNKNWDFSSDDWYSHDPCTDVGTDPAWYAPDLIDQILHSGIPHEIACHTFSHLDFTYTNCPKTLAIAELDSCIRPAEEKGVILSSMVFPGGTAGNYESLKEKGFTCYRKPMKHHLDLPFIDKHGLVAIPSSMGLDKDTYGWSKKFHINMIKTFLNRAIRHKLVCHFWFHPSMNTWYLENVLPEVVKMAASLRDENKLDIYTMKQLAEKFIKINL